MDAINSLIGASRHAQATFDAAAQEIAGADLPTAGSPTDAHPVAPNPNGGGDVDPAGQLVTMTVAADLHHVTTAALRSVFSLYQDSLELIHTDR
ncbi:MAG: hypothetical protein QOJ71_1405 [Actinomycetota bacterium]|nr:hypothetical protein [Actinomycetota bacterium]